MSSAHGKGRTFGFLCALEIRKSMDAQTYSYRQGDTREILNARRNQQLVQHIKGRFRKCTLHTWRDKGTNVLPWGCLEIFIFFFVMLIWMNKTANRMLEFSINSSEPILSAIEPKSANYFWTPQFILAKESSDVVLVGDCIYYFKVVNVNLHWL